MTIDIEIHEVTMTSISDDKTIEKALFDAVEEADLESSTTNSIRKVVEAQLELEDGFFKQDKWKSKSKELVNKALEARIAKKEENEEKDEVSPPAPPAPSPKKKKEVKKPAPKSNSKKAPPSRSSKDHSNEIAKLKSQLLKCGIRKQWNKLLEPLPNDAARVKYLKQQLTDIGLTGRFSLKKAEEIKEQQELKELQQEAASYLGNDTKNSEEETSERSKPNRRQKRVIIDDDEEED